MSGGDLEHTVVVLPFLFRRNLFGESPVLNDLLVFNPIQVDVNAWLALNRSRSSYENEVSLSQQELYLVYASVLHEYSQVMNERPDSIADPRLVADAIISGKVLQDLAVVT